MALALMSLTFCQMWNSSSKRNLRLVLLSLVTRFFALAMDMISALCITFSTEGRSHPEASSGAYNSPVSNENDPRLHFRLKPSAGKEGDIEPIHSSPNVSPLITAKKADG